MLKMMKQSAKKLLRSFGYQISKAPRFSGNPFVSQFEIVSGLNRSELTIFDVGANRGQTAAKYRAVFPDANIYCFEPFPEALSDLRDRFVDDDKVHIAGKAVAQEKGMSIFYINERDPTNSLFPRPRSDRRYYPRTAGPKDTIEVETVNIDDYVSENGIPTVDILKFDIQGGELDALRGAERLLASGTTALIYSEVMFVPHYEGAPLCHEICAFLLNFGYSLFDFYGVVHANNGQIRFGNALFLSNETRKYVIDTYAEEP